MKISISTGCSLSQPLEEIGEFLLGVKKIDPWYKWFSTSGSGSYILYWHLLLCTITASEKIGDVCILYVLVHPTLLGYLFFKKNALLNSQFNHKAYVVAHNLPFRWFHVAEIHFLWFNTAKVQILPLKLRCYSSTVIWS